MSGSWRSRALGQRFHNGTRSNGIIQPDEWNLGGAPYRREKLFDIAREWMRAAMEREDARKTTPRSRGYEASEKVKSSELCPRASEAEQLTIRISVHAKSQNQDHHYWHAQVAQWIRAIWSVPNDWRSMEWFSGAPASRSCPGEWCNSSEAVVITHGFSRAVMSPQRAT